MQVAQESAPPQSASMPGTAACTAPCITDCPPAMSWVRSEPSGCTKVILGMPISSSRKF
jgi:hypothetical protein